MNDQSPVNNTQPEPLDRHEARQQRREARREFLGGSGGGLTWVAGVILILLGVAFLLQNMGTFSIPLENWWALFIMIPAVGAFDTALRIYRKSGNQFTASARSSILAGVILSLITASFLFNLNWDIFGPILIILGGIGLLVNYTIAGKG